MASSTPTRAENMAMKTLAPAPGLLLFVIVFCVALTSPRGHAHPAAAADAAAADADAADADAADAADAVDAAADAAADADASAPLKHG